MMTTSTTTPPATRESAPQRQSYATLWRRVPGTLGSLSLTFALSMLALVPLTFLFLLGVSLAVFGIGLVLVALSMVVARSIGIHHVELLRRTALPPIPAPARAHAQTRVTSWAEAKEQLRSRHDWASLIHGLIVAPVLTTVAFSVGIIWAAFAVNTFSPAWLGLFPPSNWTWAQHVKEAVPFFAGWEAIDVARVVSVLVGVVAIVTLPWILRGLALMNWHVARRMLGPWETDDLRAQIAEERSARSAALAAEDTDLRRLERDLHDGPQQRLIRVQMDASLMEKRAKDGDVEAAPTSPPPCAAGRRRLSPSCVRCRRASRRLCSRTAGSPPPSRPSPS